MRVSHFLVLTVFTIMFGCSSNVTDEQKMYLCTCEGEPDIMKSDAVKQKVKYVYLVYASDSPDCCSNTVVDEHPGYKEVWKNEAPDNSGVWARASVEEVKATVAAEKGCRVKDKVVSVADVEEYPMAVRNYYSNLDKKD
jgi:hypothetical protein